LPVEFEFEMYGEREVRMPLFTGYLARGILLQAIRHVDPAASQVLHEPNIRKVYALNGHVLIQEVPKFLSGEEDSICVILLCKSCIRTVSIISKGERSWRRRTRSR